MKFANKPRLIAFLILTFTATHLLAATSSWLGNADADFQNPANWSLGVVATGTDTQQFNTSGSSGVIINNVGVTMVSTSGKIAFGGSSPSFTLQGGTIALFNATIDAILVGNTNASTQTIASDIVLGDAAASTISLTNTGTNGALLKITGNISSGTGGVAGVKTLSFGSSSGKDGNYEVTGNISVGAGGATNVGITKRGTGVLTLSGSNVVNSMAQSEVNSTIRITGGQTSVNVASATGWGGSSTNGIAQTQKFRLSGGVLNSYDSRQMRASFLIDGGTWNLGQSYNNSGVLLSNTAGGARLSFNNIASATAPYTFTLTDGTVTFLPSYSSNNFGVRFGNDSGPSVATAAASVSGTQTGGLFTVYGGGGQDQVFQLGTAEASKVNSYVLSGGTLDIWGNAAGTAGFLTIGADAAGTGSTTFTLTGSGKLLVRSATSGTAATVSGIGGRQVSSTAVQVLALQGGVLAAGRIDATDLRGSGTSVNGTVENNGTTVAPGDLGRTGKTFIDGGLAVYSGGLSIDLSGTTASTAWQDSVASGKFDILAVGGAAAIGGTLALNLVDGFIPLGTDTFTILTSTALTGAFSNVAFGSRLDLVGGGGSFQVDQVGNDVVVSNFLIPEPGSAALGLLGTVAFFARRPKSRKILG